MEPLLSWITLAGLTLVEIGLYVGWMREVKIRHRLQEQVMQLNRLLSRAEAKIVEVDWTAPNPLSIREAQVLRLAREGMPNKSIAKELKLSLCTVKNHVHNAIVKMGVRSRLEAVFAANRRGWLLVDAAELSSNEMD